MNKIKKAREAAGLSRKEMSDEFEIPYRTLQSWELGDRECPPWAEKLIIEKLMKIKEENEMKKFRYSVFWVAGERDGEILYETDDLADAKGKAFELTREHEDEFDPGCGGICIMDNTDGNIEIDF